MRAPIAPILVFLLSPSLWSEGPSKNNRPISPALDAVGCVAPPRHSRAMPSSSRLADDADPSAKSTPYFPTAPQDLVTREDGTTLKGTVSEDSHRAVRVGGTTIPPHQVRQVSYHDAPDSFRGAMAAVQEGKWEEAIAGLKRAHEAVVEKKRVKCRSWFLPYYHYYMGLCRRQLGRWREARESLEKYRKGGEPTRLWRSAFALSLECYREEGDDAGMESLLKAIPQAPEELRSTLQKVAKMQQAGLFFDKKEYGKARTIYQDLSTDPDRTLQREATLGIIRCLTNLADASALEQFCSRVLQDDETDPAVKLAASHALGNARFAAKRYAEALSYFVIGVVRHAPRRDSAAVRDHEEALFRMGQCYRELAGTVSAPPSKKYYLQAAAGAFRELAVTYPSGTRKPEALMLAGQMEAEDAKIKVKD